MQLLLNFKVEFDASQESSILSNTAHPNRIEEKEKKEQLKEDIKQHEEDGLFKKSFNEPDVMKNLAELVYKANMMLLLDGSRDRKEQVQSIELGLNKQNLLRKAATANSHLTFLANRFFSREAAPVCVEDPESVHYASHRRFEDRSNL